MDDLAVPDDNTDLDVTGDAHGLCPKAGIGTIGAPVFLSRTTGAVGWGAIEINSLSDVQISPYAQEGDFLRHDGTSWYRCGLTDANYPSKHSMERQAIINGNFDIWQRGTSLASLTDSTITYLADHWSIFGAKDGGTPPTIAQSRQTLTPGEMDGSFYFHRVTVDGAGSGYGNGLNYEYTQKIEHGTRYLCGNGKKVTVRFKARSSISGKKIGLYLTQNYGTGGSPSSVEHLTGTNWTLTSDWQDCEFTLTTNTLAGKTFGTSNDDYLTLHIQMAWGSTYQDRVGATAAETWVGSGNIDIAQVQLCAGDVALPFEPKTYAEELEACQRYYISMIAQTENGTRWISYPPTMRATPTIATSVGSVANGSQNGCDLTHTDRKSVV